MQTAFSVDRGNVKNPKKLKMEQYQLKFGQTQTAKAKSIEEATKIAQAVWVARVVPANRPELGLRIVRKED